MSYFFTLDLSKLKKNYWKIYNSSSDVCLDISTFVSIFPDNDSEEKVTHHSNSKLIIKGPNFENYGMTTQKGLGENLKSSNPTFYSFMQKVPKLGILKITSKEGLSEAQIESITEYGSWADKQNFIIKASKYKTIYGNEEKRGNITEFSGNNLFLGSSASETVFAGNGKDKLYGEKGNDILYGEFGNDLLVGGDGEDKLVGGDGEDKLVGGNGSDTLFGGRGNDKLIGGLGFDTLTGGNGKDTFYLSTDTGRDTITDYQSKDKLKLTGGLTENDLTIRQAGDNVRIKYDGDLMAIVQDTLIADLTFI